MYSELLRVVSPANYLTFNVSVAHVIGLINSVYCSELLDIVFKAKKKHKIDDDGFITINRDYVRSRTSINIEEQYTCDASLSKVGIIESNKDNPDKIKFDIDEFMSLIVEDDVKTLKSIHKQIHSKINKEESKKLQKEKLYLDCKNAISTGNVSIDTALVTWLDIVFKNKDIVVDTVIEFQTTLMKYVGSDVAKAMRIITIAKTQLWINCIYAIESYEKEQKLLQKKTRTTELKVATTLSDKKY